MKLQFCLLGLPALAVLASAPLAVAKDSPVLLPLKLYWHPERSDYLTVCSPQGLQDAKEKGYELLRTEGYVFSAAQPGTVPLKLYRSPDGSDYFLTATPQGDKASKTAGYDFIRTEGYVYSGPQPGAVPLKLYWSEQRRDDFTTGSNQGEQDATANGYQFVRVEGYLVRDHEATLLNQPVDYLPLIAERRGLDAKEIVLTDDERLLTPQNFRPPVEITIVAKTDSTNLRIGYAADQVIFNWELDPRQLRVDGGPAGGKHLRGSGLIPTDKYVTIKWIVTSQEQAIYVDDRLRFKDVSDYSAVNQPVSVFPAIHSSVTVKSIQVKRLSDDDGVAGGAKSEDSVAITK
jgi:hypothetical protein